MLVVLRFGYSELRDVVARWLAARRSCPVLDYDPEAGLCGRFADCLIRNSFEEQADAVWKIGSSDRWEDHAHTIAEAVIESGDNEAAKIGAELLSDVLEHFASRTTATAIKSVNVDISNLCYLSGRLGSVGCYPEGGKPFL